MTLVGFTTTEQKKELRKSHDGWKKHAEIDQLLSKCCDFITVTDEEKIRAQSTPTDKNNYFFTQIIMRLTKKELSQLIEILLEDDKDAHKLFGKTFYKILHGRDYIPAADRTKPTSTSRTGDCSTAAASPDDGEHQPAVGNDENQRGTNTPKMELYKTKSESTSGKGKGIVFIVANFIGNTLPDNLRDLRLHGYEADCSNIEHFFKDSLECEVKTSINITPADNTPPSNMDLKNLTETKFREALTSMQKYVDADKKYDRFYLFILSHGSKEGILTIPEKDSSRGTEQGRPTDPEKDSSHGTEQGSTPTDPEKGSSCVTDRGSTPTDPEKGSSLVTDRGSQTEKKVTDQGSQTEKKEDCVPYDDIIKHFQHDMMTSMKGFPKLIFFQSCHGREIVQASGTEHSSNLHSSEWKEDLPPMAVEADIMVCFAATPNNMAFVSPQCGSWLINAVLGSFKRHYDGPEDVGVIMREAKANICRKTGTWEKGRKIARQMCTVTDNLTKKFLFILPK